MLNFFFMKLIFDDSVPTMIQLPGFISDRIPSWCFVLFWAVAIGGVIQV